MIRIVTLGALLVLFLGTGNVAGPTILKIATLKPDIRALAFSSHAIGVLSVR